jgi:hypothetical protein
MVEFLFFFNFGDYDWTERRDRDLSCMHTHSPANTFDVLEALPPQGHMVVHKCDSRYRGYYLSPESSGLLHECRK